MSERKRVEALRLRLSPGSLGARRLMSVPGCWDGLSALLIEQAGFEAAFLTGGGLSMTRLGRPDVGLTTMSEVADAVTQIRDRIDLPLIVDADTGFGGPLNTQRTVRALERAGATVIQIEDQVFPKRCGHMAGKEVIPLAEGVARVCAALDTRVDALISARTDAVAPEGLSSALDRADAYLEAGADWVFVEGPATVADTRAVGDRFGGRAPLVHNLVEGGVTATKDGNDLEQWGFAVALHPLLMLHGFIKTAPALLQHLRQAKSTEALEDQIADLARLNQIVGVGSPMNARPSLAEHVLGR